MLPITARARLLSLALQKFPPGKGKKNSQKGKADLATTDIGHNWQRKFN